MQYSFQKKKITMTHGDNDKCAFTLTFSVQPLFVINSRPYSMSKQSWGLLLFVIVGLAAAAREESPSISSERFSGCSQGEYYDGVSVEDRDQLENLLLATHRRRLPYTSDDGSDDVWLAMRELHPGDTPDTVRLIYSQTDKEVSLQGEFDGWNSEHLWPRSYGVGNAGADYTDVHSIAPSDWNVNLIRGNKYFGSCAASSSQSQQMNTSACIQPAHANAAADTETNAQIFLPPATVRGDIARVLMYMDVRYNGVQEDETDLFLTNCPEESDNSMGILSQLLQWHKEDPVSDEEQSRNTKICTCWQGNRNPFIDFPDLADKYFGAFQADQCENGMHGIIASGDNIEIIDAEQEGGEVFDISSNGSEGIDEIILTEDELDGEVDSDVEDMGDGQEGSQASGGVNSVDNESSNVAQSGKIEQSSNNLETDVSGEYDVDDSSQRPFVLEKSLSCPGPGSVMPVGFNSDFPDTLALLALERISQGTTIYVTDDGWTGTEFRNTEGYLELQVPSGGIEAGTVFGYSQNKTDGGEFSEYNWETVRGNFDLSLSGDTILLACEDRNEGLTFLTGLTYGGRWFSAGGDTTYSALPETLEQFNNSFVTLPHYDSYRYVGPTSDTASRLRQAIADPDNWESRNNGRFDGFSALSFKVQPPVREGIESFAPASDPQIYPLSTSSNAFCHCWNVVLVTFIAGLNFMFSVAN